MPLDASSILPRHEPHFFSFSAKQYAPLFPYY
jgi:hypothetical protein